MDFADSIINRLREYNELLVLATTSFPYWQSSQISDIFSMEIPLSMQHRCLTYEHLVLGKAGLVVGYITELSEMYDLRYIRNAHPASSFLEFSRSSALMPIGFRFKVSILLTKIFFSELFETDTNLDELSNTFVIFDIPQVVFRSIYEEYAKGLILVSNISITDGICGKN